MRLIDVKSSELVDFTTKRPIPEYAILSHTWDEDEVSLADFTSPIRSEQKGWLKIYNTCQLAEQDGYGYVWIDTCCIDKTSSAELSEAINSMFAWYQQAAKCYVALADVHDGSSFSLMRSRWWTRGWTLQELLAPTKVFFYRSNWMLIGQLNEYTDEISRVTGIDRAVLKGEKRMRDVCIATKMSWASTRKTTRLEDEAYCLLGIFEVNMPLLYGEGARAFERLQHEIIRTATELSFMAHISTPSCNLLATSPRAFEDCQGLNAIPYRGEISITNKGLKLESARFRIERRAEQYGSPRVGGHYSLTVAERSLFEYRPHGNFSRDASLSPLLKVCFRRLDEKNYIRHPACHIPRALETSRDNFGEDAIPVAISVLEVDANILFRIGSHHQDDSYKDRHQITLHSNDVLGLQWPIAYPLRNWDSENWRIILPPFSSVNEDQIFIVRTPSLHWADHTRPMVVVRATNAPIQAGPRGDTHRWILRGYFFVSKQAYEDVAERAGLRTMLTAGDQLLRFDLTNNSFSNFESIIEKHAKTSLRCCRKNAPDLFLAIKLEQGFPNFTTWHMRVEHITKQQHYRNELETFRLKSLVTRLKAS